MEGEHEIADPKDFYWVKANIMAALKIEFWDPENVHVDVISNKALFTVKTTNNIIDCSSNLSKITSIEVNGDWLIIKGFIIL